jgi:hypothetical protein
MRNLITPLLKGKKNPPSIGEVLGGISTHGRSYKEVLLFEN